MKDFYPEKRGSIYYFRFLNPVTKQYDKCRSSKLKNRDAAIRWATLEYAKLTADTGSRCSLFRDWADKFFKDGCPRVSRILNAGGSYSLQGIKDNRRYTDFLVEDEISSLSLESITRDDILKLQERIVKHYGQTRTAQRVDATLRIILTEAVYRGILKVNPCTGVRKISYKKQLRPAMLREDLDRFLDPANWSNRTHWLMSMTARYTGLRAGEIRALSWDCVNREGQYIDVIYNSPGNIKERLDPKWGKKRRAPYPKSLQDILEPLRGSGLVFQDGDRQISYWDWHDSVVAARKAAGVSGGGHSLRHTINTELAEAGMSKELRKALFGWASDAVADGYTHAENFNVSPLSDAVESVIKTGSRSRQQQPPQQPRQDRQQENQQGRQ